MSVGLMVRLEDSPKGFFKRRRDPARILRELAGAMKTQAAAVDPLFEVLFSAEEFDSGIEVELLPGIEPIHLELGDGTAQVSASTSGGGAGYHAFVVELLEAAAKQIGVNLRTDEGAKADPDFFDETGYLPHRDFAKVQEAMVFWAKALAGAMTTSGEMEGIALLWPVDRPRSTTAAVVTPMGPLTVEELVAAKESTAAATAFVGKLLPWNDRGFSASVARNIALLLGWGELRWHAPTNDSERRRLEQFVAAVERARVLDSTVKLPSNELAEAKAFLGDEDNDRAPDAAGVGFARQLVRVLGTGGWSFEVPGYWYNDWEDDGATATWWFGGMTVRQSSFSADSKLPAPDAPPRTPEQQTFLTAEQEGVTGWAEVKRVTDDGDPYQQLTAKLVSLNHQCLLTVNFTEPASQRQAEEIFRSLRPPAPPEPQP